MLSRFSLNSGLILRSVSGLRYTRVAPRLKISRRLLTGIAGGSLIGSWFLASQYFQLPNPALTLTAYAAEDENKRGRRRSANFNFIADIAEEAGPAIVFIEVHSEHPFMGGVSGNGSGFIVRSDGLILTNAHVVANFHRAKINVKLSNGRTYPARVVDVDPVCDLATLKIDEKNLPALKLSDSDKVRPGEMVIAMGSPLSLSNTVTMGVISSASRSSQELNLAKPIDYIQTDAAINDGEVVGINSMTVAFATGISFAIPSRYAKKFLDRQEDKTKPGWFGGGKSKPLSRGRRPLGITLLPLDEPTVREFSRYIPDFPKVTKGVLIHSLVIGSPAHMAGLEPGDVITEINRQELKNAQDLYNAMKTSDKLDLTVRRKQHSFRITIVLDES